MKQKVLGRFPAIIVATLFFAAILISSCALLPCEVYAVNASVIYIGGEANGAYSDAYPNEYDAGDFYYGYTALVDGGVLDDTREYAAGSARFYQNGGGYTTDGSAALILNGFSTDGEAGYVNGDNLYGIYYDGDLTIVLKGYNEIRSNLATINDTYEKVYGIYVTGDLTIQNESGQTGNLDISMTGNAKSEAAAILCDGDLTINEQKNAGGIGSLRLRGTVGTVTSNGTARPDFGLSAAICTGGFDPIDGGTNLGGSVTVNGGRVELTGGNVNVGKGVYASYTYGINTDIINFNSGTVTATAGAVLNPNSYAYNGGESYGIRTSTYTQTGGTVTATGGVASTTANVPKSASYGLYTMTYNFTGGSLNATASDAWRKSVGVYILNNTGAPTAIQSGGEVSGTSGIVSGVGSEQPAESTGVHVTGNYSATGGSLTGTGANIGYHHRSVGVLVDGNTALSGSASLTGTGGNTTRTAMGSIAIPSIINGGFTSDSYGVLFCGNLTIGEGCTVTGTGGNVTSAEGSNRNNLKTIGIYLLSDNNTLIGGTLNGTGGTAAYGHGNNNSYAPDKSYGIYASCAAFNASGMTITAAGGNAGVKANSTSPSLDGGESYGFYIVGDASFTDCVLTASGGDIVNVPDSSASTTSHTVGMYCVSSFALSGRNTVVFSGGSQQTGSNNYLRSYGFSQQNSTSQVVLTSGTLTAYGQTKCLYNANIRAKFYFFSTDYGVSGEATNVNYPGDYPKSMIMDSERVVVKQSDQTFGSAAVGPTYTVYEGSGVPVITYEGILSKNGAAFGPTTTTPSEAGEYTVTVTYADRRSGNTSFTILPKSINSGWININLGEQSEYDGTSHGVVIRDIYDSSRASYLEPGLDYIITSGRYATDASSQTLVITGQGNYKDEKSAVWSLKKRDPLLSDFTVPGDVVTTYDGTAKTVALPTLKAPLENCGTIRLYYDGIPASDYAGGGPTNADSYTLTFLVDGSTNFDSSGYLNAGTLTINKATGDPAVITEVASVVKDGGQVDLSENVSGALGDVSYDIVGDDLGCFVDSNGLLTSGSTAGTVTVRVTIAESTNYTGKTADVTVKVDGAIEGVVFAHTLSLGNNLSINYFVETAALEGYTDVHLVAEKKYYNEDGSEYSLRETILYPSSIGNTGAGGAEEYKFIFTGIAAKEMGDDITVKVVGTKGGHECVSTADVFSIKQYVLAVLSRPAANAKLKTALVDLLNYGSAAQLHFGYNTSTLVNSSLTSEQINTYATAEVPELTSYLNEIETVGARARFNGRTLVMGNNIEIRYYMLFDEGTDFSNISFRYSYTSATGAPNSGTMPASAFEYDSVHDEYSIRLSTVAVKDFDAVITAGIYDGDTLISNTSEFSIETYIQVVLGRDSAKESLKEMLRELAKYCKSAKAYFVN